MFKIFFTTTFFIGLVMLLRGICKNHISARLQYGLWLLVAVKLLVFPMPSVEGNFSVLGLVDGFEYADQAVELSGEALTGEEQSAYADESRAAGTAAGNLWAQGITDAEEAAAGTDAGKKTGHGEAGERKLTSLEAWRQRTNLRLQYYMENVLKIPGWLAGIWCAGCAMCAAYMTAYHIWLTAYLRRVRRRVPLPVPEKKREKFPAVYAAAGLPTPCLFGRNIYIPAGMAEDEKLLPYILKHETL